MGKSVDDSRGCRITGEQFGGREGSDIIGAEAGSKREAKGGGEAIRQVIDQWKRFDGWEIWIEDKER